MKKWKWRKIYLLLLVLLIPLAIFMIHIGYSIEETGFGSYQKSDKVERGKTLWDWLDLIIAPLILALVGIGLNSTIQRSERTKAEDRMKENVLQKYIDRIEDLLLNHNLRDSKEDDVVRMTARTRTLTALRQLNPERKTILLRFLIDAELVNSASGKVVIDLSDTDLEKVKLPFANLESAQLRHTILKGADLNNSNLCGANLINSDMEAACLAYANLQNAQLGLDWGNETAVVQSTNLRGANLSAACLRGAQLGDIQLDQNTILPDASRAVLNTDLYRFVEEELTEYRSDSPLPNG